MQVVTDAIFTFEDAPEIVRSDDLFGLAETRDMTKLVHLEAKVDTRDMTLSFLGDMCPNLQKLRLNNSIIPSVRDIGCTLLRLRFLSLARCDITSLDGISTLSQNLEELYLAFNHINDVNDLMGMDKLTIVDLEDNQVTDIGNIEVLQLCKGLKALTLAGNPASDASTYREKVAELLPQVVYLDEKRLRPKKARVPRPQTPKSPSVDAAPRVHAQVANAEGDTPTKSRSVEFDTPNVDEKPDPPVVPQIQKISQRDEDDDDDIGGVMTEMLDDLVADRPPTSRGYYGASGGAFPEFNKAPQRGTGKTQKLVPAGAPRIIRPISARGSRPL